MSDHCQQHGHQRSVFVIRACTQTGGHNACVIKAHDCTVHICITCWFWFATLRDQKLAIVSFPDWPAAGGIRFLLQQLCMGVLMPLPY